MWRSLFEGIEDLFVNSLFWPYDLLRSLDSWWVANIVSWILILIGAAAFVYWMLQLKQYSASGEEDKSITSHTYL